MGEGLYDHEVPLGRVSTQCYAWTGEKGNGNVGTTPWARGLKPTALTVLVSSIGAAACGTAMIIRATGFSLWAGVGTRELFPYFLVAALFGHVHHPDVACLFRPAEIKKLTVRSHAPSQGPSSSRQIGHGILVTLLQR